MLLLPPRQRPPDFPQQVENLRLRLLQQILKLDDVTTSGPAPVKPAVQPLSQADKDAIVEILGNQASNPFSHPQDVFDELVRTAGLSEIEQFNGKWAGDALADARKLVDWATGFRKEFPAGTSRAGESTLGALIQALLEKRPVRRDQKTLISIILDHELVPGE